MKNQELLKELETEFTKLKKELKFKSSLEDIDKIFFIKDLILEKGYVSTKLSRQICSRIVDGFSIWNGYLHSLIMPNPQNMLNINECKMLNEDEKKEISNLLSKVVSLTSTNTLVGLTKKKSDEAKFIDDSVKFWKNTFSPELIKLMKKINEGWKKEA